MVFSSRRSILDYHQELVNKVDQIYETKLILANADENIKECLNSERQRILKKIKEIECHNLEPSSSNKKFCFILENKNQNKNENKNDVLLIILNNVPLSDHEIKRLQNEIWNIKWRDREDFTINDLIYYVIKNNQDPLIKDLSDVNKNELHEIELRLGEMFRFEPNMDILSRIVDISKIKTLNLDAIECITINPNSFRHFKHLKHLLIYDFQHKLNGEIFFYLENLERFQLLRGPKFIMSNTFCYLLNLKELILEHNQIEYLEVEAFNGLNNLQYLDISNNCLSKIYKHNFQNLKKLSRLEIGYNPFCQFDLITDNNRSCWYNLSFGLFGLNNIYERASKYIKYLSLKYADLFDNVNYFTNGVKLKLSKNLLDNIRDMNKNLIFLRIGEVCQLTNYYHCLDYSDLFRQIDFKNILNNNRLIFLNLPLANYLEKIEIDSLLYLIVGKVNRVPKFWSNFKMLKILRLEDVNGFDEDCFENLQSLEYLDISLSNASAINQINENTFKGLNEIRYLIIRFKSDPNHQHDVPSSVSIVAKLELIETFFNQINSERKFLKKNNIDSNCIELTNGLTGDEYFEYYAKRFKSDDRIFHHYEFEFEFIKANFAPFS